VHGWIESHGRPTSLIVFKDDVVHELCAFINLHTLKKDRRKLDSKLYLRHEQGISVRVPKQFVIATRNAHARHHKRRSLSTFPQHHRTISHT
jgi:hypothetical protein